MQRERGREGERGERGGGERGGGEERGEVRKKLTSFTQKSCIGYEKGSSKMRKT